MIHRNEKLPAILFYPGDWNGDPQLKLCSLGAQGFWMRLICVMHTCEPYGHLTFHDMKPATPKEIGQVTGVHTNRVTPLVTELEHHGVLSRTQGGVIYSRRMIRDAAKRLINQQNGQKGGNPFFRNSVNPSVKPPVKAGVKAMSFAVSSTTPQEPPLSFPAEKLPAARPKVQEKDDWRPAFETFQLAYNQFCPHMAKCLEPTRERLRLFKREWRGHPKMEYWIDVMRKTDALPFARGTTKGGRRFGIEFILQYHVKTMEGSYVNTDAPASSPPPSLGRYVEHRPPDSELADSEFLAKHSMKNAFKPALAGAAADNDG